jgi:antitoxin component YwqK of YwqJK toxin-antitoxin module
MKILSLKLSTTFFIVIFFNSCIQNKNERIKRYENGRISSITINIDAALSEKLVFYLSGQLLSDSRYKNNKLDGITYVLYESGLVSMTCIYRNGILHGAYYKYSNTFSGYPLEYRDYDENGKVKLIEKYDENQQLISRKQF